MKPISECKWEVKIREMSECYFVAYTKTACGLEDVGLYGKDYKTPQGAINNWKKFAELNGIKNYEIKE